MFGVKTKGTIRNNLKQGVTPLKKPSPKPIFPFGDSFLFLKIVQIPKIKVIMPKINLSSFGEIGKLHPRIPIQTPSKQSPNIRPMINSSAAHLFITPTLKE